MVRWWVGSPFRLEYTVRVVHAALKACSPNPNWPFSHGTDFFLDSPMCETCSPNSDTAPPTAQPISTEVSIGHSDESVMSGRHRDPTLAGTGGRDGANYE